MTGVDLTTTELQTIKDGMQILLDQKTAQIAAANSVATPNRVSATKFYYPAGSTSIDLLFEILEPTVEDVVIRFFTKPGTGGTNFDTGNGSDGISRSVTIPIGQTSATLTLPLLATPTAGQDFQLIVYVNPSQGAWYAPQQVWIVYFENRGTVAPATWPKLIDLDMSTTAITPGGNGIVSGGADTLDGGQTPCFSSKDLHSGNFTNNGVEAAYVHPLEMVSGYYCNVLNATAVNNFPIISGKRRLRAEYYGSNNFKNPYTGDEGWGGSKPEGQSKDTHFRATAGQTDFVTSFAFTNAASLLVYKNGVLQTLTTHYTVSGGGGSTGTVTLVSGATANDWIYICDTSVNTTGTKKVQAWAWSDCLFSNRFGVIEARVKFPSTEAWQWVFAFWGSGTTGWPLEIDVAEQAGLRDGQLIQYYYHGGSTSDVPKGGGYYADQFTGLSGFDCTNFNIYSIRWEYDSIIFYINGVKVTTIGIEEQRVNGMMRWLWNFQYNPYDTGSTSNYPSGAGSSPSAYQEIQIDYIRVYQDWKAQYQSTEQKHLMWRNSAVTATRTNGTSPGIWDTTAYVLPPGLVLSNSNKTVACDGNYKDYYWPIQLDSGLPDRGIRMRTYGACKGSEKRYFAVQLNGTAINTIGLITSAHPLTLGFGMNLGTTFFGRYYNYTSIELSQNGNVYYNYGAFARNSVYAAPALTYTSADIVHVKIDRTVSGANGNGVFYYAINNGAYSSAIDIPGFMTGAILGCVQFKNDFGSTVKLNDPTNTAELITGTLPSGYSYL